ncbi:multidrug ABC transporter ATP-binding protein [Paenibacillus sp. CCS19]|uniref:ABC transporter ATP-binding protein n=1 Tax=Paenibacillus sp. CCS19 TaxID=3158387 RepID=UPI00256002E2|nr:ABC transporter ATP-binding protein [Paenibacillus cellulosilyticus]GMK41351.1 multidrug ABC transporter ATP-binding protein [Paenibacillus cellulosilyticus]
MSSLFYYLKPYRLSIGLFLLLMLSGIMLELYLPTLMANMVDIGIVNEDLDDVLRIGGWMLVCSVFAVGLSVGVNFLSSSVAHGFGKDLRYSLFVHVQKFSLEQFERFGTDSLMTRTTNDIRQVQDFINALFGIMTRAPIMLLGGILLAVYRDSALSIIFLAVIPILAGTIFLIMRRAVPLYGLIQKQTDRLNLIVRESLSGIRVIRAFGREAHDKQRFLEANQDYRDLGIRVNKITAFLFPTINIVMSMTNITIIWFAGIRINAGQMQVGNLMAFLQYAMMILVSLIMMSLTFVMIPRAQASARRIAEVLRLEPAIIDAGNEQLGADRKGHIEFKEVSFRYTDAANPALRSISFEAKPGETTAIIGSTGSGKTTLLQLIARLYEVDEGSILIDGTDIREFSQRSLRSCIGYVTQQAHLFRGTIADNVTFGQPMLEPVQMEEVLQTAMALDFVQSKDGAMEAEVAQGGSNFSGGQKQRLSIARALARKPSIFLFDDSFSALDYKTDAQLRARLKQMTRNATILIVAQRISTVQDADQIIVLHEGEIVGIGTHSELLVSNGIYQEIVASQLAKEEVGA